MVLNLASPLHRPVVLNTISDPLQRQFHSPVSSDLQLSSSFPPHLKLMSYYLLHSENSIGSLFPTPNLINLSGAFWTYPFFLPVSMGKVFNAPHFTFWTPSFQNTSEISSLFFLLSLLSPTLVGTSI